MMRRKHCFDEKCLDLARYFYPHAADHWLSDLAQQFQDIAESAEDIEQPAPETSVQTAACPLGATTHNEMIKRAEGCPGCKPCA